MTAGHNVAKKQIPYYDDVVLKQHDQELELKENETYGLVCTHDDPCVAQQLSVIEINLHGFTSWLSLG